MELAPAVLPSFGHLGDRGVREGRDDALGGEAVGGQLNRACILAVLEPFRGELDEARAELFGLGGRGRDGGADQRKALLSFSKNPWSGR
jgi:hypothetical protein